MHPAHRTAESQVEKIATIRVPVVFEPANADWAQLREILRDAVDLVLEGLEKDEVPVNQERQIVLWVVPLAVARNLAELRKEAGK